MISCTQDEAEVKVGPKELAGRIADHLEEAGQLSDELIANLRNSETPLTEPAGYQGTSEGSIASAMQSIILTKLKERERDEIVRIGTSKAHDDRDISITTHSSTLEVPNRLLDQRSFAKLSKYGYWPSRWNVVQGGNIHERVDSVAGKSWELRTVSLVWKDEYYQ